MKRKNVIIEKEVEKLKIDEKVSFTARSGYKFIINEKMTLCYEIQITEKV